MDPLYIGGILVFVLLVLLGSGVWVAISLLGVAWIAIDVFLTLPAGHVMSTKVWEATTSWSLAPLPMFIWMGEILFRSRLSEDMFSGLSPWLERLPGRLVHVNIIGCGIFAAVSGSSAATCATIGRMSIPELRKRGYPDQIIIGSLAGSGTLGLLIPPSIILIVYGASAELSIARLFVAGLLPGLMLISLFMGYVVIWALRNPMHDDVLQRLSLMDRVRQSARLLPVIALIVSVIGTIYAGIATPTEAAAFGVVGALLLSWGGGSLNWSSFTSGLMGATRTSCMIAFILAGAAFLSGAMGLTGVPRELASFIAGQDLAPQLLLLALCGFFIVLGCFLDGISVVVLTTSIVLPIVDAAGIDLIWFGIFVVLAVEMSQITPPVGFNLFVLQAETGTNILRVALAALPFFFLLLVGALLITLFPEIVLFLPELMTSG